jgi:2-iminobutanoate/2-iminopropanoate deaminase
MHAATARIVVPPPCPGLDMSAGYGWAQSTAIRAGGLLFVSGVVAIDPASGERLNGTLTSEAHRAFQNLKLVLESAGSSLERLVQVRAMIYDRIEYDALNRVYRQYVPAGPPARTVWSVRIIDAFKVQLDALAIA